MEQKTVITLEFSKAEEIIAANVISYVVAARSSVAANQQPKAVDTATHTSGCINNTRVLAQEECEAVREANKQEQEQEYQRKQEQVQTERASNNSERSTKRTGEVYSEIKLRDMPTNELSEILFNEFNINPNAYEGKNTNKKLRDLILDAQARELDNPDGYETEAAPVEATPVEDTSVQRQEQREEPHQTQRSSNTEVTHDDVRELMAEVIEMDDANRPLVLKELNALGARSVGAIPVADLGDFLDFLQSLKDA